MGQGDKAFAYSWSVTSNKWEPVGEVVDSAASTDTSLSGGKQKLNGKEYDFVFEIEIEEGKKARLGMNKASNPYIVASEFIDEHDLNGDYLETIVAWLDEQMDKVCPKEVRAEKDLLDSDPFNEGKVYRAGSAAKKLNKQGQGQGGDAPKTYYDPLTGKRLGARAGEDSDSDDDTAKRPTNTPPVTHIPSSTVHSFAGAPKADSLLKKVEEVNASVEASVKLCASDLAALAHCVKSLADGGSVVGEEGVEVVVGKMFKWPGDKVLPALDVARALLMRRDVAAKLASQAMTAYSMAYAGEGGVTPAKIVAAQQKDVVLKVIMAASERAEGSGKAGAPVVFMALRALCNCFLHPEMKSLLELHIATAAQVFKGVDATHKHVQLAHASLINNYAVLFKGQPMAGGVVEALLASSCAILKALGPDSDLQAMHRVTAGAGTLIYANVTRIAMAKDLRMPASGFTSQFTCFTGTKVQILTQKARQFARRCWIRRR
jgi:phospholipase A-2-activating protein